MLLMGRSAGSSSTSLAPGFRFHPTDEELVSYYLRRKVSGKPLRFDAIADVEVYKSEPWDLPGLSKLRTRDLEWYFFSALDKKYGNGSRTNRATVEGYWKTTGKDRPVQHRSRLVGMKKTLVYHHGRAPRGERTNWVMHEYKLMDEELEKAGTPQEAIEALVLCRIFRKSGSGPKNGEQYGAPFVEEEWEEDDEVAAVLPSDTIADEMLVTDGLAEVDDPDQDHVAEFQPLHSIPPLNFHQGETSDFVQDSQECVANDLCSLTSNNDRSFINPPPQPETTITQNDFNPQLPIIASDAPTGCLPVEQYFDIINSGDGFFLEANDLSEPIGANCSDLELFDEYMAHFDAEDDIAQYLNFDASELLDANTILSDQAHCTSENLDHGTEGAPTSSLQFSDLNGADGASSSKEVKPAPQPEPSKDSNPFMKQASLMLGAFPAPPASASEFPTKEVQSQLHAALQSSGTSHYTSGVSRIVDDSETQRPFYKSGRVNVILSFDMPDAIVNPTFLDATSSVTSAKATSVLPRSWLYFFFLLWAVILAVTAKVGTCICAK